MGRLDGKVSVITGGGAGIGKSVAEVFASEGSAVVIMGRREEVLKATADAINAAGGDATYVIGDVINRDDVKQLMKTTVDKYGKIDVLVNNAAMGDSHLAITRLSEEMWDEVIETDLKSVYYTCKEALVYMEKEGKGSIINVASIGGVFGSTGVSYSAAKSGVLGLTKNIAIQFAGTGIRCNAISPGPTKTSMNPDKMKDLDMEMLEITGRHFNINMPWATTEDHARVMLYYASDDSVAVNGQNIIVDNGMTL